MSSSNNENELSTSSNTVSPLNQTGKSIKGHFVRKEEMVIIQQSNMPDVATLEGYARIIPGGAERFLALIEKQVEHRIQLENTVIPQQVQQSNRGQLFGFILAIIAFLIAIVFLFKGHADWAGVIATSTALGMAAIFVTGKLLTQTSLKKKDPQRNNIPQQRIEKK